MKSKICLIAAMTAPLFASDKTPVTGDPNVNARVVSYHFGKGQAVYTQKRWTTVLYLDPSEKIVDIILGDQESFAVHPDKNDKVGVVNWATITTRTDAPASAKTDLTIMTASGNLYSVIAYDVTGKGDGHADTQVTLELADAQMKEAAEAPPRYVSADEAARTVNELQQQLNAARTQVSDTQKQFDAKLQSETDRAQTEAVADLHTRYQFDGAKEKPFSVAEIYDNGKFTFLKTSANESFAVYAVKDGKPVAVNLFPNGSGLIRLDRVVDNGYLKLGKKKADFHRED